MTTAAALDALLARPRATQLEADMAAAILDWRVTVFGPVPPGLPPTVPPLPPGSANYTVSQSDWAFNGNFRLNNVAAQVGVQVSVDFTTPATLGVKAQIQPIADPGYFGSFDMTIDGRKLKGQSPPFLLVVGPSIITPPALPFLPPTLNWQGLAPSTRYRITFLPNKSGSFHVNFQSAS